jgi:hypothetical protein
MLNQLLDQSGRAEVVVTARFDGPMKVIVPKGTPPEVAQVMRGTNSRYGHMNQYSVRLVLLSIDKVDRVDSGLPWPRK